VHLEDDIKRVLAGKESANPGTGKGPIAARLREETNEKALRILKNILANGPLPSNQVRALASEKGLTRNRLDWARERLHVKAIKVGKGKTHRSWCLPGQRPPKLPEVMMRQQEVVARPPTQESNERVDAMTEKPKPPRGRPRGTADPEVANRKREMLESWDRRDFGTNKAETGRAYDFDRSDATKLINEHDAEKLKGRK
jgi:hypothetical protein